MSSVDMYLLLYFNHLGWREWLKNLDRAKLRKKFDNPNVLQKIALENSANILLPYFFVSPLS